ncbi:MAG TPA: hypothetical protein VEA58_02525, partial [Anaerovoracaceae bacterium]|nr:hypothetical protein [Anaerovoracaceae bacterium]
AFFKSLNYMAFRMNLYRLIAQDRKADLILSPIRSALQWSYFNRFCFGNKGLIPQMASVVHRNNLNNIILRKSKISAVPQMDHINFTRDIYYPAVYVQEIPLFSVWIATFMGAGSDMIRSAYELREEKEFAAARNLLSQIGEMVESNKIDDFEAMDFIMTRLNRQLAKITKKYRINTGKRSPVASCALISNGVVFRSVREDLIRTGDMGVYFDFVTSKINYKPEASLQDFKFELAERNGRGRWWMSPM